MDDTTIIGSTLENKSLRRFKLGLYPLELIIADPDYSVGKFWFLGMDFASFSDLPFCCSLMSYDCSCGFLA